MGMAFQNPKANEGRFREKLKIQSRSKFVGVRQRASGKWAAEIKDTSKKIRLWLGTYQTAEEAARAYDEAACFLRGSNARTNFSTHDIASNSPICLKLRNLLDRNKGISNQIETQNQSSIISPTLENNSASESEGKSSFWVQNKVYDNLYGLDMSMINCTMGIPFPPNTSQYDYSWILAQQRINDLPIRIGGLNVERQSPASESAMNESYLVDTYDDFKYEMHDVNYPLSLFLL